MITLFQLIFTLVYGEHSCQTKWIMCSD